MPINKVARAAIEELRSRFGVNDLTPDEVLELNDLGAAQLAAGKPRDGDERIAAPVRVGNVLLHPLTCAASDFLERFNDERIPAQLRTLLIPFAMAHGRSDELAAFETVAQVRKALRAFRRAAGATKHDLDDAASELISSETVSPETASDLRADVLAVCAWICAWDKALGDAVRDACLARLKAAAEEREAENPRGAFYWRRLAVELGALTGLSPDYWYDADRSQALVAWRAVWERESRQARGAPDENAPVLKALKALRQTMARIVDSRKPKESQDVEQGA